MTSAQVRAARGLLNWTVRELSARAEVHRNTVTNFETGRYAGSTEVVAAIRNALERGGVVFLEGNGDGPGVRIRKGDNETE